jgi:hypothetical protein
MNQKETCGNCFYGRHLTPIDLAHRRCFGNPPQVLPMPQQRVKGIGPDGKAMIEMTMTLQNVRPIVQADEDACAHHKPRSFEDVEPKLNAVENGKNEESRTGGRVRINA